MNVEQDDGKVQKVKCYGVINKLYLHFMYPPEKSTYKLNGKSLPKMNTPWILCALCQWYEHLGEDPETGLTRIIPNAFWAGCPLQNLSNCYAENVVYWPETPFDIAHFDKDGEPTKNIKNGKYDYSGTGECLVITH